MTFVSLPVTDVAGTRTFWTGVGVTLAERFCDDDVLCVLVSDRLAVMLVDRARFTELVPGAVVEPHAASEVVISLAAGSRDEVDGLTERAVALGGTALRTSGVGPVYGRSFADPDGHVWEVLHVATGPHGWSGGAERVSRGGRRRTPAAGPRTPPRAPRPPPRPGG